VRASQLVLDYNCRMCKVSTKFLGGSGVEVIGNSWSFTI